MRCQKDLIRYLLPSPSSFLFLVTKYYPPTLWAKRYYCLWKFESPSVLESKRPALKEGVWSLKGAELEVRGSPDLFMFIQRLVPLPSEYMLLDLQPHVGTEICIQGNPIEFNGIFLSSKPHFLTPRYFSVDFTSG